MQYKILHTVQMYRYNVELIHVQIIVYIIVLKNIYHISSSVLLSGFHENNGNMRLFLTINCGDCKNPYHNSTHGI
jgi:hypothetical protein